MDQQAREREGVSELSEIEVDEVSLVDRPATGRRFVLFKRGGLARRGLARGGDANIGSVASAPAEPADPRFVELEKRAADAQAEIDRLRATTAALEDRLSAVEARRPGRQSDEAAPRASLWSGVL